MAKKYNKRTRKNLKLKPIIFVAAEGEVTEKEYCDILSKYLNEGVSLNLIRRKSGKSRPKDVLNSLKPKIKNDFNKGDKVFLLLDRDEWSEEDLLEVISWADSNEDYNFIISNPSFDLWILLHLQEVKGGTTQKSCIESINKHWSRYNKHLRSISKNQIFIAAERAKNLSSNKNLLVDGIGSDMYKFIYTLVEMEVLEA